MTELKGSSLMNYFVSSGRGRSFKKEARNRWARLLIWQTSTYLLQLKIIMFATNQKPVEIGGMRERSVHIVKFQNINLSIFDIKAICSLPCLFMELQWLRRERQRGRGAITRLSLWRHLLVVVSRHRLVCVNRTTELSGWAWSLTSPSAPESNKEEDNDDWWRRTRILLNSLKRR